LIFSLSKFQIQNPYKRYSSISDFFVYDISERTFTPLSENGRQRIPQFSPDGSKIAFVRDNNSFIIDLTSGNGKGAY